jgi:hypothetical protein
VHGSRPALTAGWRFLADDATDDLAAFCGAI